jgi:hypothetical protein
VRRRAWFRWNCPSSRAEWSARGVRGASGVSEEHKQEKVQTRHSLVNDPWCTVKHPLTQYPCTEITTTAPSSLRNRAIPSITSLIPTSSAALIPASLPVPFLRPPRSSSAHRSGQRPSPSPSHTTRSSRCPRSLPRPRCPDGIYGGVCSVRSARAQDLYLGLSFITLNLRRLSNTTSSTALATSASERMALRDDASVVSTQEVMCARIPRTRVSKGDG